jgi:hypothetical protein
MLDLVAKIQVVDILVHLDLMKPPVAHRAVHLHVAARSLLVAGTLHWVICTTPGASLKNWNGKPEKTRDRVDSNRL